MQEIAGQSPVVRLVNHIILNAVKEGASDIHVEPSERSMRVRYRIDGRLHKALEVPQHLLDAVTSRIKIMGAMDVGQRRLPQDGRGSRDARRAQDRPPRQHLPRRPRRKDRDPRARRPGRLPETRRLGIRRRRARPPSRRTSAPPNGVILVTGPTGSGKSTTLYAALAALGTMENNVCTVEDPIECHLPLVNQFQVQTKIGMTFSDALRTLLRQDPDVIMVGEIRDEETARTTIQAALDRTPRLQHLAHPATPARPSPG